MNIPKSYYVFKMKYDKTNTSFISAQVHLPYFRGLAKSTTKSTKLYINILINELKKTDL